MSRRIIWCLLVVTLAGCSTQRQIEQRNLADKELGQKCDLLWADNRLDILRTKTAVSAPLWYSHSMLIDLSFPTDEEREAMGAWVERFKECGALYDEFFVAWEKENLVSRQKTFQSRILLLAAQLDNREINWLGFNTRGKEETEAIKETLEASNDERLRELDEHEASVAAWRNFFANFLIALGQGMQGYADVIQDSAAARQAVVNSQYERRNNYGGNLSTNPYDRNSTSNPYGRYGSPYSSDSLNNPYGAGSPYRRDSPNNPYGSGRQVR